MVVENKRFGEVTLLRLMTPDFLQALVVTVCQVVLIVVKVRPELTRLREQGATASALAATAAECGARVAVRGGGVEMGQVGVLTSAGMVT
jgi:hypothetical protein